MLEVGRITRPHGVRGDVNVVLTTNRTERVAVGTVLHTDDGPLTVRSSRPHKSGYIVTFEECADRERAEALRGTVLLAEPIDDPDELWVHELIGAVVIDAEGVLVYQGAIDNAQDGDGKKNFVVNAVTALKKGEAVSPNSTRPYGCGVKY